MFSQARVKKSVQGEVYPSMYWGRHPLASTCWDTHPLGRHLPRQTSPCPVHAGIHPLPVHAGIHAPPRTAVGDTHATGMHSCFTVLNTALDTATLSLRRLITERLMMISA